MAFTRAEQLAELLAASRILHQAGFCLATDGNFSARVNENTLLLTRSGIEKRALTEESFVDVDLASENPGSASSEWQMHRALYRNRPEIACVLHVHSPFLTTFAAARKLPPLNLLAEARMTVGEIVLVPFCLPGTRELGERLIHAGPDASVYLLANHGVVATGGSVREALHRLERSEFLARIAWQTAALGGAIPLSADELQLSPSGRSIKGIPC